MIGFIQHRGPDATGLYIDGPVGLAHARLSIIDLSGGDQPIHNEDKTAWIVFNGEIFNYPELRADLEARGHRFYTQSDTEVLVHLYEELGTDMFKSLNGQFAFAIWDKRKKELLLARDRVGIRPLFYHQDGLRLLFGSEVKAIFADPNVPRRMDLQTLRDVFTCWAPLDGATSFEGIRQLPAGHFAVFSRAGMKVQPYWQLLFNPEGAGEGPETSFADWTEGLSELLVDATRIRLRADVPVGAYLSGGLDSTLTSAIVKRNFDNRLRTFSVSFTDGRYDEAAFQITAVNALKTDHSQVRCSDKDIGADFPKIVWHAEVPLLRTAPAPLYRLSRLVRENNFKVVLTGEGADEMFAGYNIFKEDKVRRFWARNPESKITAAAAREALSLHLLARRRKKREDPGKLFQARNDGNRLSGVLAHDAVEQHGPAAQLFFGRDKQWRRAFEFYRALHRRAAGRLHVLDAPLAGAIHRDTDLSHELPALFPRGPHGHGPRRGRSLPLPRLPGDRIRSAHTPAIQAERPDGEVHPQEACPGLRPEGIDRPAQAALPGAHQRVFLQRPIARIRRRHAVGSVSQKGRLLRCHQGPTARGKVQDKRRTAPERAREHGPGGHPIDPAPAPAVHRRISILAASSAA